MTVHPPLETEQAIGLPVVEAAILYGSPAFGRHRPVIERAGVELVRRPDASD